MPVKPTRGQLNAMQKRDHSHYSEFQDHIRAMDPPFREEHLGAKTRKSRISDTLFGWLQPGPARTDRE